MELKSIIAIGLVVFIVAGLVFLYVWHDKPVTTDTLGKICSIMKCQPGDLIEYIEDACEPDSAE